MITLTPMRFDEWYLINKDSLRDENGEKLKKRQCEICCGTGRELCDNCDGDYKILCAECDGQGTFKRGDHHYTCAECDGQGYTICAQCAEGYTYCKNCALGIVTTKMQARIMYGKQLEKDMWRVRVWEKWHSQE